MKELRKNGNLYLCLAFVVMAVLFYSSAQTYEQQSQIGLLERVLKNEPFQEFFSGIRFDYAGSEVSVSEKGYFAFVEFLIRKTAHFGSYFLLGSCLFLGLNKKMSSVLLVSVVSWLSATGYAAMDEFHQMLTGGRTPLFQDVMLDSFGAVVGIVSCLLFYVIKTKK